MSNGIKPFYDVAIVGAGPCGATCANLLGKYGISALLIDQETEVLTIPRAIGICEEGSRILQNAGALDGLAEDSCEIDSVHFTDKNQVSLFHASLNHVRNGFRPLRMFYQPRLERRMRQRLKEHTCVDFHVGTTLENFSDEGDSVSLLLKKDNTSIRTRSRYLLGCDGAKSIIRKALNIGFTGSTYPQDWMILDIDKNPHANREVAFTINPERPSVTMPAPGNKRRWEFVVKNGENPDDLFEESNLAKLLKPWGRLEDMHVERKAVYTFHARTAENYRKGNIFLLGDAAHITPPFAGQGMMAGFRDAFNLCWKIAAVIQGSLNENILDTYEPERIPQSRQIVMFAQRMGNIILPQNRFVAGVRDLFFKILGLAGLISDTKPVPLNKIPNHINGTLLSNFLKTRVAPTGIEIPQFLVTKADEQILSDEAIGDRFVLLGWEEDPKEYLSAQTLERWNRIHGACITVSVTGNPDGITENLYDPTAQFRSTFDDGKRLIMIRPDKMIIINSKPKDLDGKLSAWMDQYAA